MSTRRSESAPILYPVAPASANRAQAPSLRDQRLVGTGAAILALQRLAGNAAVVALVARRSSPERSPSPVQRLAMTEDDLKKEAGDPKPDKMLPSLPGIDDRPYKKMSQKYQGVIAALRAYHAGIRNINERFYCDSREGPGRALIMLAYAVRDNCLAYRSDHEKKVKAARQSLTKLAKKNPSKKSSGKREKKSVQVKRFDTIQLLDGQMKADIDVLGTITNGDADKMRRRDGMSWRAVIEITSKTGTLDAVTLTGDPLKKEQAHSFTAPKFAGRPPVGSGGQQVGQQTTAPPLANIQVLAGSNNPIVRPPGVTPNPGELYTGQPPGQGQPGVRIQSPVTAPQIQQLLLPNNLFINNTVSADEIIQGSIGDCYILAAIAGIANKDPQHITGMMSIRGQNIVTMLYRLDPNSLAWVQQPVSVPQTLASDPGKTWGGGYVGTDFKIAPTPTRHEWYAELGETIALGRGQGLPKLTVKRRDFYQAALWAPYLEKSHAKFAETYGQYGEAGKGTATTEGGNAKSGYKIITGGRAFESYALFYGSAATGAEHNTDYDPSRSESDNVSANKHILEFLLRMKDPDLRNADNRQMGMHLTVQPGYHNTLRRAEAMIDFVTANQTVQSYLTQELTNQQDRTDFTKALGEVKTAIADVRKVSDRPDDDPDRLNAETTLQGKAVELIRPSGAAWTGVLRSNSAQKPVALDDLFTLLGDLLTFGQDNTGGQRYLYSRHQYTIIDAKLKNGQGDVIGTLDQLNNSLGQIDTKSSTVTLYNPHHANTPNPRGTGEIGTDGRFDLPLHKFLVHMGAVDVASIHGHRNA